jgi:hypothetical protein
VAGKVIRLADRAIEFGVRLLMRQHQHAIDMREFWLAVEATKFKHDCSVVGVERALLIQLVAEAAKRERVG